MTSKLILIISLLVLVSGCGSGSGSSSTSNSAPAEPVYRVSVTVADVNSLLAVGGTLFTVKNSSGDTLAAAGLPRVWNTYCQNASNELQFFVKTSLDSGTNLNNVSKPNSDFRTGYGYSDESGVYASDFGNYVDFKMVNGSDGKVSYQSVADTPCKVDEFSYGKYNFKYEIGYNGNNGYITACPKNGGSCDRIAIATDTFVYSYVQGTGSVLAITNAGDIVRWTEAGGWTRAARTSDNSTYFFPSDWRNLPLMPDIRRQFYSSIVYGGVTLIGQWPDGRLYAYDEQTVSPWLFDRSLASEQYGLEAQSLALYCDNLYVGYWPRGEVWIRSNGSWSLFKRFFSAPLLRTPFMPYYPEYTNPVDPAFYGQRVTSISNFGDSLYFFTSNLRQWYSTIDYSAVMNSGLAKEYGEIHKLTHGSCGTTFIDKELSSDVLEFEINKSTLRIKSKGTVIFEVKNESGVVPSSGDHLIGGEGIFGNQAKNLIRVSN